MDEFKEAYTCDFEITVSLSDFFVEQSLAFGFFSFFGFLVSLSTSKPFLLPLLCRIPLFSQLLFNTSLALVAFFYFQNSNSSAINQRMIAFPFLLASRSEASGPPAQTQDFTSGQQVEGKRAFFR